MSFLACGNGPRLRSPGSPSPQAGAPSLAGCNPLPHRSKEPGRRPRCKSPTAARKRLRATPRLGGPLSAKPSEEACAPERPRTKAPRRKRGTPRRSPQPPDARCGRPAPTAPTWPRTKGRGPRAAPGSSRTGRKRSSPGPGARSGPNRQRREARRRAESGDPRAGLTPGAPGRGGAGRGGGGGGSSERASERTSERASDRLPPTARTQLRHGHTGPSARPRDSTAPAPPRPRHVTARDAAP